MQIVISRVDCVFGELAWHRVRGVDAMLFDIRW